MIILKIITLRLIIRMSKDVIGEAVLDYLTGKCKTDIIVSSNISEDDIIPIDYLFRKEKDLPLIERKALNLCKGKTLDVGAGSGAHSLILQNKEINVKAIEISEGAVEAMKLQGVKNVELINYYDLERETYDTLLFLMNGIGIAGNVDGLKSFFEKAKTLLNQNGQILLDSSDIQYMFTEEDGSLWMNLNSSYYGEVTYEMQYKNTKTDTFNWLFLDYEKLSVVAGEHGFNCEKILEGEHFDFLAKLTLS